MKRSESMIKGFALIACATLGSVNADSPMASAAATAKMRANNALMSLGGLKGNKVMVTNKTGENIDRVTAFFRARGTVNEKKTFRKGHTSIETVAPGATVVLYANKAVDKKGGDLMGKFHDESFIKSINLVGLQVGKTKREFPHDKKSPGSSFVITTKQGLFHHYVIETEKEYNDRKAKEQRAQAAKEAARA